MTRFIGQFNNSSSSVDFSITTNVNLTLFSEIEHLNYPSLPVVFVFVAFLYLQYVSMCFVLRRPSRRHLVSILDVVRGHVRCPRFCTGQPQAALQKKKRRSDFPKELLDAVAF